MITVAAALVPLYTVASQYEYRLAYVHTNSDYTVDPLLESPDRQFRLDTTLNKPKLTQGPAAG
jgi:hypothetical protein